MINITALVEKPRKVLVRFKSLQEIVNTTNHYFDQYGNLYASNYRGVFEHLAPCYFSHFGKQIELSSHHSFPDWAISKQWDDLFAPNLALRSIASGKMEPADAVELAKKAVIVP